MSDDDINQLAIANEALERTSPDMRRIAIEYLWDRWVAHPNHDDAEIENEEGTS